MAKKKQTFCINIDFFEDSRKQAVHLSIKFSTCNPFPSWSSAAKETCFSFSAIMTNIAICHKTRQIRSGIPRHKFIFWVSQ